MEIDAQDFRQALNGLFVFDTKDFSSHGTPTGINVAKLPKAQISPAVAPVGSPVPITFSFYTELVGASGSGGYSETSPAAAETAILAEQAPINANLPTSYNAAVAAAIWLDRQAIGSFPWIVGADFLPLAPSIKIVARAVTYTPPSNPPTFGRWFGGFGVQIFEEKVLFHLGILPIGVTSISPLTLTFSYDILRSVGTFDWSTGGGYVDTVVFSGTFSTMIAGAIPPFNGFQVLIPAPLDIFAEAWPVFAFPPIPIVNGDVRKNSQSVGYKTRINSVSFS